MSTFSMTVSPPLGSPEIFFRFVSIPKLPRPSTTEYNFTMNAAEILAELPKLHAQERERIMQRLFELQEEDLLRGIGPSEEEKEFLDQALAEFRRNPQAGSSWEQVKARILNPHD
jgi:hypothetical protein